MPDARGADHAIQLVDLVGLECSAISGGLELPILVIHGDDDQLVPIEVGRNLAHNNSAAELLEVSGGSHMLPITHAALLSDRIASFSAPPPASEPAAPPGADAGAPEDAPEHWMDALATR